MPAVDPDIQMAPAYPRPSPIIFNELRQRVALASGVDRSYIRLAALLGLSKSTLSNWCMQTAQPAVQVMFGLLERLPDEDRAAFIRRACRVHPTLDHPALTHDPTAIDLLRELLRKQTGLTIIKGESARLFVLHALGHCYSAEDPKKRPVTGLIFQSPHGFVPAEGMFYLRPGLPPDDLKRHAREVWPRIVSADTSLVILEGVWSRLPELRSGIRALAQTRHVILADDFRGSARAPTVAPFCRLKITGTPATVIHIARRYR